MKLDFSFDDPRKWSQEKLYADYALRNPAGYAKLMEARMKTPRSTALAERLLVGLCACSLIWFFGYELGRHAGLQEAALSASHRNK